MPRSSEYAGAGSEVFFGRAIQLYAHDYFATHALPREGLEEVRRLAALTGETCQFCMPIGNKYAVVAMQNSARLFRIGSDIGVLVPIPWTASGRLFVAHHHARGADGLHPARRFSHAERASHRPGAISGGGESGARARHLRHRRARRRLCDMRCRAGGRRPRRQMRRLASASSSSSSSGPGRIQDLTRLLRESARKLSLVERNWRVSPTSMWRDVPGSNGHRRPFQSQIIELC